MILMSIFVAVTVLPLGYFIVNEKMEAKDRRKKKKEMEEIWSQQSSR